jgi:NADPH-dependent 2,4-dienoyl-CoA reductase/sulfur reductase-like enzyme
MTGTDLLVVGASAAGLSTVEALRRHDYRGRISVLGAERHLPYDRPPLSKQVLAGDWGPDRAQLRSPELLAALDVEFILGEPALALDVAERTVHTANRSLTAGNIVIATGTTPRRLPGQPELAGVHVLRTVDDALALRADLLLATRLVVVGEGVLGAEIAATARGLGLDVTMTGPQRAPMAAQIGDFAADLLARLHIESGVSLRLGAGVTGFSEHAGRVAGVSLDTGEILPADVVVVAIGASPAAGWLADSALTLADGVVCDSNCCAAEGIYAAGDVARWDHATTATSMRLENRTNATEQAAAVAEAIVGAGRPYLPIPYFWSDQYGTKIQVHGIISADADGEIVDGDFQERRFVARYVREGVVTAILGWNMPKQTRLHRLEIGTRIKSEGVKIA